MRETFCRMRLYSILVAAVMVFAGINVKAEDSAGVKAKFINPPREYSTAPFWVWNDMMTDEQVASTLRELAGQGIRQAFVHPRPGLMTPYLSEEWFRLWKVALKEAEKLGMDLWIYDENSYPSGFAGGFVPDAMPQSRGQGLAIREQNQAPELTDEIVAVYVLEGGENKNVTEKIRAGAKFGEGKYLVVSKRLADRRAWYGGKYYVDLLRPGVTEKFLEVTLEAYRREIGEEFGKRVPGSFTDEPRLSPAGGHHWTDDLPEAFERRWGYSLVDNLPSLFEAVGGWKRVRHNYFQVLLELCIERWGKPYYEYCEKNNLEFTGHYWEHEWPNCMFVPDNMAMYAWQQRPGIDTLMNQYREDTHAQFGNVRAVKELASVANQLGLKRTLCEAYGASGWDLRFEDMKRIGDWLYVLGINTMNEHLSWATIRGARKNDHPPSFSYHEPWWEAYGTSSRYFGRLSAVLSAGEQVNKVLVIEPTTTAWIYQVDAEHSEHLKKVGDEFQELVVELAKSQVKYDIGCEEIIRQHGSVEGSALKVGKRRYETVVVPPLTENLNSKTMELLEAYVKGGGEVMCCGEPPMLVDGVESNRGKALSKNIWWREVGAGTIAGILVSESNDGFTIHRGRDDEGILYHHRRLVEDGEILFLVNTSIDSGSSGKIESSMRGVERWDAETGKIFPYAFERTDDGIKADFDLAQCGSLLLFLSKEPTESAAVEAATSRKVGPAGLVRVRRVTPNVLKLDYVDVTADGETMENTYFYKASEFVFKKHGLGNNPWDHAVQFRDELISKKFAADSGFEATYRFSIKKRVPKPLYIVIERPDLYDISCNGKAVTASEGSWWLDKAFGKVDITSAAKVGENTVTIKASPMTMYHELESAYVLGEFALKAADSGFVIIPDKGLKLGRWDEQGHPFYADGVSYAQNFNISEAAGRYYVRLTSWYGSVAKVVVNGEAAGYIWHQPWELEVTEQVKAGRNSIEVTVIGTLKNTLGPHHGEPALGTAWPGMFRNGPRTGPPAGEQYETIGYGLFEPFELVATEGKVRQAGGSREQTSMEKDPYQGPRPLAVLLEENPWLHVIGSDTPSVVLYEDGTLIYLELEKQQNPIYKKKPLEQETLSKIRKQIGPTERFRRLKEGYTLKFVTDQPTLHVYLSGIEASHCVSVYGVSQEQIVAENYEDLIGTESSGEWFPKEFYRVCRELSLLRDEDAKKWVPTFTEIILQESDTNNPKIPWPEGWADLSDPLTTRSPSGELWLLYMDGSKMEEVVEYFTKTGGIASINGKNYYAGGVRAVFPSEPVWRRCFFKHY